MDILEITAPMSLIIALVIGVAQALKTATGLNSKFIPILDIALGLLGAFVYSRISPMGWPYIIIYGLIMGLSACGLFSAGKNVAEGIKEGRA